MEKRLQLELLNFSQLMNFIIKRMSLVPPQLFSIFFFQYRNDDRHLFFPSLIQEKKNFLPRIKIFRQQKNSRLIFFFPYFRSFFSLFQEKSRSNRRWIKKNEINKRVYLQITCIIFFFFLFSFLFAFLFFLGFFFWNRSR